MLSLGFSHVATIASPFFSSVFHFLAELSKICRDFLPMRKENNEIKLVTQECNDIQPQFDGTNYSLSVRFMTKSSR